MVGPDIIVKGGISSIINALKNSTLIENHKIRFISTYIDCDSKLKKLIIGINSYFELFKEIRNNRPDLVHIHTSFGASFYRKSIIFLICSFKKIKMINHIHGAEFQKFFYEANFIKKYLIKKIYNLATITIVLSKSWETDISQIINNDRVEVLNNFAIIDKNQTNYDLRNNNVIFMGEVGKRKGAYDLPDIIENVLKEIPDTFFYICGNGDIEAIKYSFNKKFLNDNVLLTGWISGNEKKRLLSNSKIFLLPTYNEGQPMAIIEAMAYKLPIVSTCVGGIPELIKIGENGFLEKPGEVLKISKHIINLLKDNELSGNISMNNYKLVNQKYSIESYINNLNSIYFKVYNIISFKSK